MLLNSLSEEKKMYSVNCTAKWLACVSVIRLTGQVVTELGASAYIKCINVLISTELKGKW